MYIFHYASLRIEMLLRTSRNEIL